MAVLWRQESTSDYLSHCCDKIPGRRQLREVGFVLAHSVGGHVIRHGGEKAGQREQDSAVGYTFPPQLRLPGNLVTDMPRGVSLLGDSKPSQNDKTINRH